jgi:CRP-like cAMP-binding protein
VIPPGTSVGGIGAFLGWSGQSTPVVQYGRAEAIFSKGETADSVMHIEAGGVELSARSTTGRKVVIAVLGPGDFFGQGSIAGQRLRAVNATALTPCAIRVIGRRQMARLLDRRDGVSHYFIAHILARNIVMEGDLVDQILDSCEKRLARTLLLLAQYGQPEGPQPLLRGISRAKLAAATGAPRARVGFFMNRFRDLGFIDYSDGTLRINHTLLSVLLHE